MLAAGARGERDLMVLYLCDRTAELFIIGSFSSSASMSSGTKHSIAGKPYDSELFDAAWADWCPTGKVNVISTLPGGYSGAAVLVVDVQQQQPNTKLSAHELCGGFYVLKLDKLRPFETAYDDESKRHEAISRWAPNFMARHMVPLVRTLRMGERLALLYEIAGGRFSRLVRSDMVPFGPLTNKLGCFSIALLTEFNPSHQLRYKATIESVLHEWLSWRVEPGTGDRLSALVDSLTCGRRAFVRDLHILGNPLSLIREPIAKEELKVVFDGMLHGDLHQENLFWDRVAESMDFWIIDFAFSCRAPLLFDHAYFEVSLLLQHFLRLNTTRLLGLLDSLIEDPTTVGAQLIAPSDEGMRALVAKLRSGIRTWQINEHKLRADSVDEQMYLARVAAGLNWAAKLIGEEARLLAFCYAAHATRTLVERFYHGHWHHWAADADTIPFSHLQIAQGGPQKSWLKLWTAMRGFSAQDVLVLISDRQSSSQHLSAIGLLPLALVIDFDPESDTTGLLSAAKANLEQQRSVQVFGKNPIPVSFTRATAWMLAYGSKSLNEPTPKDVATWRRTYKRAVQQIAEVLKAQTSPSVVRILVLAGERAAHLCMLRALEELLDELSSERYVVAAHSQGNGAVWNIPEVNLALELSGEEIAAQVSRLYGDRVSSDIAMVPGVKGPVEIDVKIIRNLEEDFEILHTTASTSRTTNDPQQFWRGGPPSWHDIETGIPVERDVVGTILGTLQTSLRERKTCRVELQHAPGSGGTTASLMVAWRMRNDYPTAVLHGKSRYTADRLGWLFHLTGLPVLLVADASVLSKGELDDVLRTLAKNNVRAVILHVVRVTRPSEGALCLVDPMPESEAQRFAASFSRLTADTARAARIHDLGYSNNRDVYPLRSPFFFGLVTFEEEFTRLDTYVAYHLTGVTYSERKLVMFLALIATFSQSVLSTALAKLLVNASASDLRNLSEILSSGPGRLVIEWNSCVKLVHPLIGREILRQLCGGEHWKSGLPDLCIDFANQLIHAAGGHTDEVRQVFKNLFIQRDDWDDSTGRRDRFSPLIEAIGNSAAQARVLGTLTEICADEPHYWNHRGRHMVYTDAPNFAEAERHLQKAVQLSARRDAIHLHALGMVKRFWIRSKVRELRAASEAKQQLLAATVILDEVGDLAADALAVFEEARQLKQDDVHNYITPVQTALFIIEELVRASGGSFEDACASDGRVAKWIREHIALAEQLLARLRRIRGLESEDAYEIECLAALAKLYSNFSLIKTWEAMLEVTAEPTALRHAITALYLARRKRQWSTLEPKELRRICKMSEDNLRSNPTDVRDLRNWFQASRRLPEFNYYEAIDRLNAWAKSGAIDAYYYLYILHFIRGKSGGEDSERLVIDSIEKCSQRQVGPRGFSHEWLANGPAWCPIIGHTEVGKWDRQSNFFENTSQLAFATGPIETIKPQTGTIRLGRLVKATFIPPPNIRESAHLNDQVHFYLGFSYEGLRAWGVTLGAPPANRAVADVSVSEIPHAMRLWIGGVPWSYKDADIRALFEPWGRVDHVELAKSAGDERRNKGFAFVTMRSEAEAQAAIEALDRKHIDGRQLTVRFADTPKPL